MTIRTIKLRAINDIAPYTLAGATGAGDHEKRINIVKLLESKTLVINTIPISDNIAAVVDLTEEATCVAPMKASGIVLVRAFFDDTDNTGRIEIGRPVAFDMVTGVAVTGVNDTWLQAEYHRIGLSLDNFSKVSPYDGPENLIQVKIDSPEQTGDGIFAMTPVGGIPARVGLEISSAKCKMYREVDGPSGKKILEPVILSGGGQKEAHVFNIVNAAIGSNKIVATDLTRSKTRYVNVESCLPEA